MSGRRLGAKMVATWAPNRPTPRSERVPTQVGVSRTTVRQVLDRLEHGTGVPAPGLQRGPTAPAGRSQGRPAMA